jgi:LytS/YehU family sensor histidine kinase
MERASMFEPVLKTAMVAPLKSGAVVLGALAAYSATRETFTEDHQYAMERIAAAFLQSPHCSSNTAGSAVQVRTSTA